MWTYICFLINMCVEHLLFKRNMIYWDTVKALECIRLDKKPYSLLYRYYYLYSHTWIIISLRHIGQSTSSIWFVPSSTKHVFFPLHWVSRPLINDQINYSPHHIDKKKLLGGISDVFRTSRRLLHVVAKALKSSLLYYEFICFLVPTSANSNADFH